MFIVHLAEYRKRVSTALGRRLRARASNAALAGSLAVALLLWVSGSAPATAAQGPTRIFVAVQDSTGAPVTDLAASDFLIRIDGADRQILSVTRATTPLSIVLLTDQLGLTSSYPLSDLRDGLAEFVRTIRGASAEARFALLTFDGAPNLRTRFDSGPAILEREMARLVGVASNSVLLDGVHQAAGLLAKGPTERRAILNVFAAYRPDVSVRLTTEVGQVLRQSAASLWSIEVVADIGWQVTQGPNRPSINPTAGLGEPRQISQDPSESPSGGAYASMPREVVIADGGVRSGGMRQTVTSRLQLAPAIARVAELLLAQYEIVYAEDRATATSERLVAVRRKNVTVLAPSWVRR
jgi:hypothetical protein